MSTKRVPLTKKIFTPLIIGVVILLAIISAVVAQYQRSRGPLAPTAPQSQPAAAESSVCTLVFDVVASPTPTPTPTTPGSTATPTPTARPTNTPTPTPTTPGSTATPTPTPTATPTNTPTPTPTPSFTPTPTPSPTPVPGCNTTCTDNSDCNANHVCYTTGTNTKVCRLASNPSSESCAPATPTPTPTPSATPAPGCNTTCTVNADCNQDHICYETDNNTKVCRLATNPTNSSCAPATAATNTPTPSLPQAGGTNTTAVGVVIVGVLVVVIGAIGLLLLL